MNTKNTNFFITLLTTLLLASCEQNFEVTPRPASTNTTNTGSAKIVLPQVTLTACGYGFTVHATASGQPYLMAMQYEVRTMANVLVDSGTVFNEANTTWVLNPCTQYKVIITSLWWTQTVIQTTDGCGGIFIC